MRTTSWIRLSVVAIVVAALAAMSCLANERDELSAQAARELGQGNFKDAYDGFRKLALDPETNPGSVGNDLRAALQCLQHLNRMDESDALLEEAVKVHKGNWLALWSAAEDYAGRVPHYGFIVAGKFYRGDKRGGGRAVSSVERDRIRALQLMVQAMPMATKDEDHAEASRFFISLAGMLLGSRGYGEAWRLQTLSDLKALPDYEERWIWRGETAGAPVDANGQPVFHHVPKGFDAATTDGQRWRWCLQQAVEMDPARQNEARMQLADFCLSQFGVQTMAQWGWRFGRMATDDTTETGSGICDLHTLGENETTARLATGIKRFALPDEFNYIKIYQQIAADEAKSRVRESRAIAVAALEHLAQIFENRRQYPKAADYWRRLLSLPRLPDAPGDEANRRHAERDEYIGRRRVERDKYITWQQRLDQIVGNWGRFEPSRTQPAGRGAALEYRFRNGREVEFTAHEINVEKLLADVKAYLKARPQSVDWRTINIDNIGYRLVQDNEQRYLGSQVAQWRVKLTPRENHFDKRVTVTTPLQKPGAYLVRAKMAGGNTCFIVVWVDDTAIIKKPLTDKCYYFVADAVTGRPIAKANLEFFGWSQEYRDNPPRHDMVTRQFAEYTDADGQATTDTGNQSQRMQWLVMARTPEGRFAYLGFSGVWYGSNYDAEYNATKVYAITDRPVYRPEQKVHYKFWIRHAQYDMADTSEFANREFAVEIRNPKGDKILSDTKRTDAYGGIEGEYAIPADATLGVFYMAVRGSRAGNDLGGGSFRVEEYKKPEFEVTVDAPAEPVTLGQKITATIRAKYYFGSPVTNAKVKYKVNRTSHDGRWYPSRPWDWFYGPGYWWFGCDYTWYPGWRNWGCLRPTPLWWPRGQQPPELVAEQEVAIGSDGTVKVEIDTALAKAIHADQDHSYAITAEVVDQSRRTIVGSGTVLVARKPFTVYAWLDRGYLHVGDTISAHFSVRTLDGKPVCGRGELRLLKISYQGGKPVETAVQSWKLDTDTQGEATQQMTASQAGQYRLSYRVTSKQRDPASPIGAGGKGGATSDASPHPSPLPTGEGPDEPPSIEGGFVFTVTGEGFDGSQFRFNHLELIPDKQEYKPGDVVKLQINTDRPSGTVLLFVRPTSGVYLPPKLIRLKGKSTIAEIGVMQKDMPNFFVEADTIADGRVYTEVKEIVVPPEKRILNVEVLPEKLPSASGKVAGGKGGVTSGASPHPNPLPEGERTGEGDVRPKTLVKGEGAREFRPGEKAKVKIKLTDMAGRPFVGSTVVAIYDKSLEYISGGSNVADIKEFFWKWRRQHSPETQSSLDRWFPNLDPPKSVGMGDLGVFGGTVADETVGLQDDETVMRRLEGGRGIVGGLPGQGVALSMTANAFRLEFASSPQGGLAGRKMETGAMPAATAVPGRGAGGPAAPLVQPTVRTKFADTALWVGALTTSPDGTADASLDMPENLTTWRIKVWALGHGTRVGEGFCDVVTRKDVIVRLEAPRFFVQSDEVVVSAIVHNYLSARKSVEVALELGGNCLQLISEGDKLSPKPGHPVRLNTGKLYNAPVEIAPNGEARVDWRVKVLDEGRAVIRAKALTDEESDAMEQRFPCYIHGMAKMDSYSGSIPPRDTAGRFTVTVPEKRRPGQSRLEVRWSPTLAGAMVDALPYMVDYPYGCTEQTLNRFLPTVITQKILLDMKLDLKEIQRKRTNLNAQELGEAAERAKQWGAEQAGNLPSNSAGRQVNKLPHNPVFDEAEVRRMVKQGVERLTGMQCSDGGWGWFSGWGEHSDPHTTALVVHGLQIAEQNNVALAPGVLERGVEWLTRYQSAQVQLIKNAAVKDKPADLRWKESADNLDAFVYMVLTDGEVKNAEMLEFLYRDRTRLAVYGMAMYGVALEHQGEREKLAMVLRNLRQYVEQDDENQTAWLRLPQGSWWCWYGSEYEAHAYYLKLLARTDPHGELAPRIVKYLLNNRKNASYWNSTRDTALCIEGMADFIRRSGEDRPQLSVEVYFDGKRQKTVEITPQNLFTFDNTFVLEGDVLGAGEHTVELRKKGAGPIYFNGYLSTFTLEDFILRAGLEIKVNRKYYKLVEADKTVKAAGSRGQAVDERVEKYERQALVNDAQVRSGDLVEVELEIDSKNDYEYLVFEDMKPAGFEPVDLRSGYTENELGAYVEFRDNRVVFFARTLARGKHSVSYRVRAETPGHFSALPTRARAMYAPELKGNSDEIKLRVSDTDARPAAQAGRKETYVPKDLDDCFAELKRILSKEQIEKMKAGTEGEMIRYHHLLGMWLRNNWGLWKGSRLSKWFNGKGVYHPDDMSGIIFDSFWRQLNGSPIKFDEQVKHYQDYWKAIEKSRE